MLTASIGMGVVGKKKMKKSPTTVTLLQDDVVLLRTLNSQGGEHMRPQTQVFVFSVHAPTEANTTAYCSCVTDARSLPDDSRFPDAATRRLR